MYFQLFMIICVAVFMWRVAEFERRSTVIWASVGVAWCIVLGQLIDYGVFHFFISLLAAYFTMALVKAMEKP